MKAVDFNQPELLLEVFAKSGTRNTLPVLNTDASNPQLADLTNGFPIATQGSPDDGKLPPERADFNALGFLTTSYDYFYQAGGTFTFNSTIATAIGGYPKGARLWYTNAGGISMILRSTQDDNTDNFITTPSVIGTSWVIESLAGIENTNVSILDYKFSDKIINKMSWILSDNSWLLNSTYASAYTHLSDDIGFIVRNDSGTVKIGVSCTSYTMGDYVRNSTDDLTISGTTYYAWEYSTDVLYVSLDISSMSADDAVSALQGQRIYKYEDSTMSLTIHKISISTADSYEINGNTVSLNVLVGSDGHRIVLVTDNENETVDTIYNAIGVAWYYVLDKTNQRFKLPRTKYGFNGYRGTVGKYIEAGLPDHIHHYGQAASDTGFGYSGAGSLGNNNLETLPVRYHDPDSIYGNSTTVQPPATEMYLYFYVGEFNDTAIQQTAGITASTINGKMDVDIGNITAIGKETMVEFGEPDWDSVIQITLPYTTPTNGYIVRNVANSSYIHLNIGNTGIKSYAGSTGNNVSVYLPTKKGIEYTLDVSYGTWSLYFVPCIGG